MRLHLVVESAAHDSPKGSGYLEVYGDLGLLIIYKKRNPTQQPVKVAM